MELETFFSDYALSGAYFLFGICVLGVIVFPLVQSISDPAKLIKPLIGIVLLGGLYAIGYVINGDAGVSDAFYPLVESFPDLTESEGEVAAATVTRHVGAAFFVTTILTVVATIGILVTELAKFFR